MPVPLLQAMPMTGAGLLSMQITGLRAFWEAYALRQPRAPRHDMRERMLLDTLGLGLEQTLSHLGAQRPDPAAFLDWIAATAGMPDPLLLARYEAILAGAPMPPAAADMLAAIDAMDPVLGDADLAHWDAQGYVVLRGAVSAGAAEAAAAALWAANDARPDDPDSWYRAARTNGIMVQLFQHPALEAARRSARVHKAFAQLWGTSDLWMTIDRMGFNPPERPGHGFYASRLHWDVSLARPIPFATQAVLYLTDTAEDQGALELVPGFHRRIHAWLDGLGDANPRTARLGDAAVCVPAGAGDLVIWRQDLPHGASPNRAAVPRLVQYLNMYSPLLTRHAEWR